MKDTSLRDRLKAVRADLDSARSERAEKAKEKESAKEAFAKADMTAADVTQSDEFKAAEQAVKAVGEVDDKIADLKVAEGGILSMLGRDAPEPSNGNGPTDPLQALGGSNRALEMLKGEAYEGLKARGAFTSHTQIGSATLGMIASRDDARGFISGVQPQAADVDSTGKQGAIPADRRGIISPLLKPLTLLDLIPSGTTDSNVVEYVQVTETPGAAKEVAEGTKKPEETLKTQDADAPVRTIAGFIKIRKQALADVAGLASLINQVLPYDVRRRIESQILVGDGEGSNLKGILNTTGIGTPEAVEGDNRADTILRAVTTIVLANGDPNFVALHPTDWQELLLMRENEKERTGAYLYGTPAAPVAPTIWGLSITKNAVVPADSPLIGDANGAMLMYREGLQVLVSDSDGTDFVENRVTVLAEARVALPVWRPASFAVAPALNGS